VVPGVGPNDLLMSPAMSEEEPQGVPPSRSLANPPASGRVDESWEEPCGGISGVATACERWQVTHLQGRSKRRRLRQSIEWQSWAFQGEKLFSPEWRR
jgi:hypothetical protein